MKSREGGRLWQAGVGVLLAGILGAVGQPAAAQRPVRKPCKAAVRAQAVACIDIPREGITLAGPNVRVVLKAAGIEIAAVAQGKAGAAHFHVFLDVDLPPTGDAIPQGAGITHLGSGQKELILENLAPGVHRLIVVLGDNGHIPVPRQQSDTTYFSVAKT